MDLTTGRLSIRSPQPGDVEALVRLWTDPEVTRFMGGPRKYDDVLATLTADAVLGRPPMLDLWPVLERETGRIVGHCGA
ncbi:MAG: GNAT family N-acetyltransferase [Actinomycetota bacterium]|nr:GNAT family N-acetyltransferase [Actinomycetota bacterium]